MSDPRTPRRIIFDMEPLVRALCNGTDAAVAVACSDHYAEIKDNGILYIAEAINADAGRLQKLYDELADATQGQPLNPTPPEPLTLVTG
jgi:hypothetical protein